MHARTSRAKRRSAPAQTSRDTLHRDIAKRVKKYGVVILAAESPLKRVELVRAGLAALVLDETAAILGIAKSTLIRAAGIPVSTAGAQQRSGKPRSPEHSEKILRVLRATMRVEEVFGDKQEGRGWITDAVPALGGRRPLDLLDTQDGYELVMNELDRIVFGAPA